jgi:hypothetical protein
MEKRQVIIIGELSEVALEALKKQHNDAQVITVDGADEFTKHCIYVKKPDRRIMSLAMSPMNKSIVEQAEVLLKNCFIGGDENVLKDDDLFLAASVHALTLLEVRASEIKKL